MCAHLVCCARNIFFTDVELVLTHTETKPIAILLLHLCAVMPLMDWLLCLILDKNGCVLQVQ